MLGLLANLLLTKYEVCLKNQDKEVYELHFRNLASDNLECGKWSMLIDVHHYLTYKGKHLDKA